METSTQKPSDKTDDLSNALMTEEDYLLRLLEDDNLMRSDIQGAFARLQELLGRGCTLTPHTSS